MTIWFDMDGTIADLYAVEGWLDDLHAESVRPYIEAEVLVNMSQLARLLHRVQKLGYKIGVISWGAKNASASYLAEIDGAKREWITKHLPSVQWDYIMIEQYGMNKAQATGGGILFDDEEQNRNNWQGKAFTPDMIMQVLKELA